MWRSNSISKPRMRPPPIPSNDVASSVNGIHTFQSLSIFAEQIGAAEIRRSEPSVLYRVNTPLASATVLPSSFICNSQRANFGRSAKAKARGVRFGRKLKMTPHQILEALARREARENLAEIGRSYNVSHSTISKLEKHARHELLENVCNLGADTHCVSERSQFIGVMSAPTSGGRWGTSGMRSGPRSRPRIESGPDLIALMLAGK